MTEGCFIGEERKVLRKEKESRGRRKGKGEEKTDQIVEVTKNWRKRGQSKSSMTTEFG